MAITNVTHGPYTNDIAYGQHYVTLYMISEAEGEPRVMEPDKCERWEWFEWDELPEPLFTSFRNLLESGYSP